MPYPLITNIHLTLTHRCNMACRYCFVHQEPLDMTWAVAKDAIDFIAENGKKAGIIPEVCLFGGEPLLMWDQIIVPLVSYIRNTLEGPFKINMTTNTLLLTADKYAFLKSRGVGIHTSIDGDRCTQNYNRPLHGGGESFDIVDERTKMLIADGRRLTLRATIIPETCAETYNNYLYAIKSGFTFTFFITDTFSNWTEESQKVLSDEMYKIADHYIAAWKKDKKAPIGMGILERFWNADKKSELSRWADGELPNGHIIAKQRCGLGQGNAAAISPTGDIYGCQELTSNEGANSIFYIGNIYTGVSDQRRFELAKSFADDTTECEAGDCLKCPLNRICTRACVANSYLKFGKLGRSPIGFCFFQRLNYEVAKYIKNELLEVPEFMQSIRRRGIPSSHVSSNIRICDDSQLIRVL